MRNFFYKILILLLFCFGFIQTKPLKIIQKHQYFKVDNLGNIYFVNHEEITKYNAQGKLINRYSNLKLGDVTSLDVTNPLKIIAYYRDFQQLVFLDNLLSVNSEPINLEDLGYEQTELVCASANNSFWIYDNRNAELIRFNAQSKIVNRTGNLNQILEIKLKPNFLLEQNGMLYMNCIDLGIQVFDIYGTYSKAIGIKGLNQFQLSNEFLYYQRDSNLVSYNTKLFFESTIKLKVIPKSLCFLNSSLYCGYSDSLVTGSVYNKK